MTIWKNGKTSLCLSKTLNNRALSTNINRLFPYPTRYADRQLVPAHPHLFVGSGTPLPLLETNRIQLASRNRMVDKADINDPMTKQNMNFAFYLVIGSSMQLPDEGLTTARLWEGVRC